MNLSVVLAVFNEEDNLKKCLTSIKDIASEIVIVDGGSSDKTVDVAHEFGACVIETDNPPIFHINKQKAIEAAKNSWILQLDADEVITKKLADEIMKVISMSEDELEIYQTNLPDRKLFQKHQKIIFARDGRVGDVTGDYNAFFIPRRNLFLGKYLKFGGTYPDPAIRLIRKGKAYLPSKDVHEQMAVEGRVGWLENYMLHNDSPTFSRYLKRNSRYINLMADQMRSEKLRVNLITGVDYLLIKPLRWFLLTQIRHKGILDGFPGIIFSFFSALRFPRAYLRYLTQK